MEGFETGSFGLKICDPADVRAIAFKTPFTPQVCTTPARAISKHDLTWTLCLKQTNPVQTVIDVRVTKETYHDGLPEDRDRADWDRASDNSVGPPPRAALARNV